MSSNIASRRIMSEFAEWQRSPPERWSLAACDEPLREWVLQLEGTELYQGETFLLKARTHHCRVQCAVTFTPEFPMQAPEFVFLRPSPVHPHIYSNGHICLDILYDHGAWSPALTIASVARSLLSMLAANSDKSRPHGDADYCKRVGDASSRRTRWTFHDDRV